MDLKAQTVLWMFQSLLCWIFYRDLFGLSSFKHTQSHCVCKMTLMLVIMVLQCDIVLWLLVSFRATRIYFEKEKLMTVLWALCSLWAISCKCLPMTLALWERNPILWARMTKKKIWKDVDGFFFFVYVARRRPCQRSNEKGDSSGGELTDIS